MLRLLLLTLSSHLLLISCQHVQPTTENTNITTKAIAISPSFNITLLDSLAATTIITKDATDNFFTAVTPLDMAIQMKKNYQTATPREQVLADYQNYLKSDVTYFSKVETEFVQRAFLLATERLKNLSVNVLPQNINLIKTTAKHYGASTYYTREDAIIIPNNELTAGNLAQFTNVMLHEIFHIYSRNHPTKKLALYQLIGFRPIENIIFPAALQQRLLLNPDGVNPRFGIRLKKSDTTFIAIPLIVSKTDKYQSDRTTFFEYLYFDLFPLKMQADSSFLVQTQNGWQSPIHYADFPDFYQQIRDNTDYIIHPDEILADNFVLLINKLSGVKNQKKLSKEGESLLTALQKALEMNG